MGIKVLGNRILGELIKPEEKTTGGLIMPKSSQGEAQMYKVKAIGVDPLVEINDTIVIGGGIPIKIMEKDYVIIENKDILIVLP
jgi:co-chaperonin GroES (HSP10)